MCYHTKLKAEFNVVERVLNARFKEKDTYKPKDEFNGFTNPDYPLVRWDDRKVINQYEWGLLGDWLTKAKITKTDKRAIKARNGCLNAQLEELEEKVTFKNLISNRCLIPMDGMYEWQWADVNDPRCKKTKYLVTKPDDSVFCCAGLFNEWTDPSTGIITYCYTICTTEGNELMKEIKNEGQRMLVVLNPDEHEHWLNPKIHYMEFQDRTHIELVAELAAVEPVATKSIRPGNDQLTLF